MVTLPVLLIPLLLFSLKILFHCPSFSQVSLISPSEPVNVLNSLPSNIPFLSHVVPLAMALSLPSLLHRISRKRTLYSPFPHHIHLSFTYLLREASTFPRALKTAVSRITRCPCHVPASLDLCPAALPEWSVSFDSADRTILGTLFP